MSEIHMPSTLSFDEAVDVILDRGERQRSFTAIAGPPAAGKSTIAASLVEELNRIEPGSAAILQMDGFHYDDRVLKSRNLLNRKGAPETFDTGGLMATLVRLRKNREPDVAVPVYDREIETARAGAALIPSSVRHIIVEGNYLLLRRPPWNRLADMFDTTIFVSTDMSTIRERLLARWHRANLPPNVVAAKVEGNDLPNAQTVIETSAPAEFLITSKSRHARAASRA